MKRRKLIVSLLLAASIMGMSLPAQAASPEEAAANTENESEWYIISLPADSTDMNEATIIPVGEEGVQASLDEVNALQTAALNEDDGISLLALENVPGTWIQAADGRWWYQHTDGGYSTNAWEKINGSWYYFNGEGWMHTGWLYYYDHWYYCEPATGKMMVGWYSVNGKTYYSNPDGWMMTGWVNTDGWYYCNEPSGEWVNNTGTQMIQEALKYVGYPYKYGGNSLTGGVDCSGYTQQIHLLFGISILRTAAQQYSGSHKISSPLPGDLAFFGTGSVSHVAFYMGRYLGNDNYIVHASTPQKGICTDAMSSKNDFIGYGSYWR